MLTFVRPALGCRALYVGEDRESYHVLGGNQSDRVSFARFDKQRMRAGAETDLAGGTSRRTAFGPADRDGRASRDEA